MCREERKSLCMLIIAVYNRGVEGEGYGRGVEREWRSIERVCYRKSV